MAIITQQMVLLRETKNTVVYVAKESEKEGAALASQYISKSALTTPYPQIITVEVGV